MKASLANKSQWDNYTPRLVAVALLAGVLLCVLTGCRHQAATDAQAASAADIAGAYALVGVDGRPVPCAIRHEGRDMNIKSGSFTITAAGQCSSRMVVSVGGSAKDATIVRQATYERSGTELTMRWKGFGRTKGTVAGSEFTMNNEGMILTYRK